MPLIAFRSRLLALFVGLAGAVAAPAAMADCLRYGGAPVVLSGILEQHTFPGPPASRSAPGGDTTETDYYLRLRSAACAVVGPKGGADAEARKGVWLVQLVPNADGLSALRPRLGHAVRVRGRLFSSHTEHHHAPLLLEVAGVEDER